MLMWLLLLPLVWVELSVCVDFNVVIPEICLWGESSPVNVSWIKEMVLLGIREDRPQLTLNILGVTELCDGSSGLLKLISLSEDESGQVVGSLSRHLCDTAATSFLRGTQYFASWTCPKMEGVVSIQPDAPDVILAITRLIAHLSWREFAFTKLENDKSPYCDEMGKALRELLQKSNNSIMLFPSYEDVHLPEYSGLVERAQGLFLCISYYQGLTHYHSQHYREADKTGLPIVLLPEWPLPLDIVLQYAPPSTPSAPVLSLLSHPQPYNFKNREDSSPPLLELEAKPSWESFAEFVPLEPHNHVRKRILEPLLARLILHSMKVSMEYDLWKKRRTEEEEEDVEEIQFKNPSFRFLVFKYEKDRWHPMVNLVGNLPLPQSPLRELTMTTTGLSDYEKSRQSIISWLQIIGGTLITFAVLGCALWLCTFAREKYRNHLYTIANTNYVHANEKKLVPRTRTHGPYKLLLTSRDICFGNNTSSSTPNPTFSNNEAIANNKQIGVEIVTPINASLDHTHHLPFSRGASQEEGGSFTEKPDLIKGSVGLTPLKKTLSKANLKNDSFILTENQARYKGDLVHLRRLVEPTSDPFEIKSKAMNVLETIHGLRHENLVALIGVLTDGIPSMVWEFCSRGSLHDIIKQQDIKLDWAFKLSLLTDLVRGMKYLHSSLVRVHGFLTSSNCVIDARWVLKITDYGVLSFHHNQPLPLLPRSNKELLWTAPELLRDETLRKHGTQPGDVYSFAIIMQEILVRGEPYCMLNLSTEDILDKVQKPPPLIRPSVSKGAAPPEAINIMRQCWNDSPDMRPDFVVIHDLFKTLNHGRKANIVDTCFEMLEKYSNNLEELIRERTEQLDLERKKTEQLLNRMLPSTVAEKLKVGLPVDPEEFPEVTIYFSDIVGFTTISAYSTPFEVVDLLNDLYTCFDATINDYNVYKVETIGDAYMVVGGAPLRTADHADQIATMALDLLYESGRFRIRHLPFTPLRLRIGIHTGSVCGGVVGLTMPRYCLFGDTVNVTSRMESTGAPWRIHISSNTKCKLESIGGYIIEYRGVTDIKGKGKMPTYWLLGKEGFDKELPLPPPLSEPNGLDEKSIIYGRTGIPPASQENLQLNPRTGFGDSRPNSQEGSGSVGGGGLVVEPLKGPAFSLLQGESLRCLSPAEEVAHQLLNGRPAVRGLRRQFSLDQGTNYYIPLIPCSSTRVPFRKTPSLEETFGDHHYSQLNNRSLQRNSNSNSSLHQLSFEVPSSTSKFIFNPNFSPVIVPSPPPTPLEAPKDKPENKELSPDSTTSSVSKSSKVTLSPRTGRIFKKSSSLTIVEESPFHE